MIPAPSDVAAPPADATRTDSGLAYKVLSGQAKGDNPGPADKVTVHYTGWTAATGVMFDSSVQRGQPITFGLNQVIAGWTEGLQLMTAGQKARFWIPGDLAYGNTPGRGRPHGMLVFDVELLSIEGKGEPAASASASGSAAPDASAKPAESAKPAAAVDPEGRDRHRFFRRPVMSYLAGVPAAHTFIAGVCSAPPPTRSAPSSAASLTTFAFHARACCAA